MFFVFIPHWSSNARCFFIRQLWKAMWRRQNGAQVEEVTAPIDSAEQDELILSLKNEASHQDLFIRRTFCIVFFVVSAIFCGCFVSSLLQPFAMVHQQRFEGEVPSNAFSLFYLISAVSFATAAVICQVNTSCYLKIIFCSLVCVAWIWRFFFWLQC